MPWSCSSPSCCRPPPSPRNDERGFAGDLCRSDVAHAIYGLAQPLPGLSLARPDPARLPIAVFTAFQAAVFVASLQQLAHQAGLGARWRAGLVAAVPIIPPATTCWRPSGRRRFSGLCSAPTSFSRSAVDDGLDLLNPSFRTGRGRRTTAVYAAALLLSEASNFFFLPGTSVRLAVPLGLMTPFLVLVLVLGLWAELPGSTQQPHAASLRPAITS